MRTNSLFVDTSGWMAYLVVGDNYHVQAVQEMQSAVSRTGVTIYTTDHVLAELVALMQGRKQPRALILYEVGRLLTNPRITKLYTDETLFLNAWNLLIQRPDKNWSLADAISILRMQEFGMAEALTN